MTGIRYHKACALALGILVSLNGAVQAGQTQEEMNAKLRGTPDVYDGLFTAALIKHIVDSCPDSIDPPGIFARVRYFMGLYNKARKLGASRQQIEAFVEDDAEQERMRQLVFTHLRSADVDPKNKPAVCAYASDQIAQATALGKRLREK